MAFEPLGRDETPDRRQNRSGMCWPTVRAGGYTYLGPSGYGYEGEIQIFHRLRSMVGTAKQARRQVLDRPRYPRTRRLP
jgi:hypothetical protein